MIWDLKKKKKKKVSLWYSPGAHAEHFRYGEDIWPTSALEHRHLQPCWRCVMSMSSCFSWMRCATYISQDGTYVKCVRASGWIEKLLQVRASFLEHIRSHVCTIRARLQWNFQFRIHRLRCQSHIIHSAQNDQHEAGSRASKRHSV